MRPLLFLLFALFGAHVWAATPTQVLVLHAYTQEYPWTRGQHQGFVAALEKDPTRDYALMVEYLDSKRLAYSVEHADFVASYLLQKYQGYRPAAIYVTDDNAYSFARTHLGRLFPDAPVFFSGVNDYAVSIDPARATGVFERKDIAPNLRLMREIDPTMRDVLIVGDASETYRAIERDLRRELERYPDVRATFISGNRIDDLVMQLRARKERFVILTTLGAVVNGRGETLMLRETVREIVKAGEFVVFSMEDAYLFPGVLGGYVTSGPRQGDAAANLMMSYLGGTPVWSLPPVATSPNEYRIDESELQRAGLVLPRDIARQTTFVNKRSGFYETNRSVILNTLYGLGALLFVSLTTLLVVFVRKTRQVARTSLQLREVKDSLDRAQRMAQMGNWDWHVQENRLFWSDGIYHVFGMRPAELDASYEGFVARVHPDDRSLVEDAVHLALETAAPYEVEHRITRRDGSVRTVHESVEVVQDTHGRVVRMIGTVQDITARKEAEQHLQEQDAHMAYLAYHDALTGLPNRMLLMDRIAHAVSRAHQDGHRLALLFIDLDRFKTINDSLGHAVGDALLKAVAERLQTLVPEGDTLSRLGGDEFVVVFEHPESDRQAENLASSIIEALEKVFLVGNYPLHVSASVGISRYPEDGNDAEALLKHADAAMYKAKEGGRNTFHFYEQGITERALRRVELESRLRDAFARRALEVFYQPLVELGSRRLCGAEALLRWRDPVEGAIPPDHFVPLAEDTGLIIPIGEWVLREACLAMKRWQTAGHAIEGFVMHVNLSGKQLLQKTLPQRLAALLAETGVPPSSVVLELTESSILEGEILSRDSLMALRETGVSIAIDDFGTGHSSLSRLKLLPISEIKIDRSFIRDIAVDRDDAAIVQAILALSANLDLQVVAEGVEATDQEAFLLAHGCHRAQGYFYARPMPEADLVSLLGSAHPFPQANEGTAQVIALRQ